MSKRDGEKEDEALFMDLYKAVNEGNLTLLKSCLVQEKYKKVLEFHLKSQVENKFGEIYKEGETILHIAADRSDAEAAAVLLEAGADPNSRDNLGRIPLHLVLDGGCRCKRCSKRNDDCLKVLLESNSDIIDTEDNEQKTPLYYAANNMMPSCASILLEHEADKNHKTGKIPVGFLLVQKIPEVMVMELDKGIKFHTTESSKLFLDFRVLLQNKDSEKSNSLSKDSFGIDEEKTPEVEFRRREMELLDSMLKANKAGRAMLLTHPLTEAFLFLKWKAVSKWFWIIRILYYLLAILYTFYIFNVFLLNCEYPFNDDESLVDSDSSSTSTTMDLKTVKAQNNKVVIECQPTVIMLVQSSLMSVGVIGMMLNEIYEITQNHQEYFRIGLNYAWWLLFLTVSITIFPGFGMDIKDWQYPIAGFSVFYAWGMTLVQVGRIPQVGVYVEMLGKVLTDFAMFFATYFALLIGFALGFCVLFPQNEMFQNMGAHLALVKVILIMTGDSDYEGLLYEDSNDRFDVMQYSILAHIMFIGFIIIITIVLMNLLLGLAVSDIQELQKTASLITVSRQIQQISLFENLIHGKMLPSGLKKWAIEKFSIVNIINRMDDDDDEDSGEEHRNPPLKDGNSNFLKSSGNNNNGEKITQVDDNYFEFCPTDPLDKNLPERIKSKFIPYLTSSPCLHPERYKKPKHELRNVASLASKARLFAQSSIKRESTIQAPKFNSQGESETKSASSAMSRVISKASSVKTTASQQQMKLLLQSFIEELQRKVDEITDNATP